MKLSKIKSILTRPLGKHKHGYKCPKIINFLIKNRVVNNRDGGTELLFLMSVCFIFISAFLMMKSNNVSGDTHYKLSRETLDKLPSELKQKIIK